MLETSIPWDKGKAFKSARDLLTYPKKGTVGTIKYQCIY